MRDCRLTRGTSGMARDRAQANWLCCRVLSQVALSHSARRILTHSHSLRSGHGGIPRPGTYHPTRTFAQILGNSRCTTTRLLAMESRSPLVVWTISWRSSSDLP